MYDAEWLLDSLKEAERDNNQIRAIAAIAIHKKWCADQGVTPVEVVY